MAFSKVCWQIPPCLEPYWSQKFAHCSGRLCGQEEMVSHGPATPVTRLFSWRGERKWSLCGVVKPRKTLKIPLNFHTLLAAEMYDLLGGEKTSCSFFFPPHCPYFRGYLRDQVMILQCFINTSYSSLPTIFSTKDYGFVFKLKAQSCQGIFKIESFCNIMCCTVMDAVCRHLSSQRCWVGDGFKQIYLFIYFWPCWAFVAAWSFLQLQWTGAAL